MMDKREEFLQERLKKLSKEQINKIIKYNKPICCDTYSYDRDTGRF